jgi:hypothetical protein
MKFMHIYSINFLFINLCNEYLTINIAKKLLKIKKKIMNMKLSNYMKDIDG